MSLHYAFTEPAVEPDFTVTQGHSVDEKLATLVVFLGSTEMVLETSLGIFLV